MVVKHMKGLTESERFDRIGWTVTDTGCWGWKGYVSPKGYGRFHSSSGILAHRYTLSRALGRSIAEGMSVMHSCDNGKCVNPEHLSEGTHFENMVDSIKRNRKPTKLTPDQVLEIYRRTKTEGTYRISKEFGVVPAAIRAIRDGRNWKWLTQQGRDE